MSFATVTLTTGGATVHYWFVPEGKEASDGSGLDVPSPLEGYLYGGMPLSVQLDQSVKWDVIVEIRNAYPIHFEGLDVSAGGGDLIQLLAAQGWQP